MVYWKILLFGGALLFSCNKAGSASVFGVEELATKHQLPAGQRIEVLEFMWLACPQCREVHPTWVELKKEFGESVDFRTLPAPFPNWEFDARVFLALQGLGLASDGLLANYYEARQVGPEAKDLGHDPMTVAQWLENRYNVRTGDFIAMLGSSLVDSKLKDTRDLLQKYPIKSVPVVLVSIPQSGLTYIVGSSQPESIKETIRSLLHDALSK